MAPTTQPTTQHDVSTSASTTAAPDESVGLVDGAEVRARLIEQVETLLQQSGNWDQFDAADWVDRWLRRPNHALGGASPELYLNSRDGEAVLSSLIGAMAAGSYM